MFSYDIVGSVGQLTEELGVFVGMEVGYTDNDSRARTNTQESQQQEAYRGVLGADYGV